jgi:regulatory protein
MKSITAITPHARRDGRYRLEVDGEPMAVVDAELLFELQLKVGGPFDADLAERVAAGAARLAAFDKGLAALAVRARSERELAAWLAQKGHAAEDVLTALERLVRLGFLNDADYARAFARSRAVGRGMSRRRIEAELARRGVARELALAAIASVLEDEGIDERALAEAAAGKKLRSLARFEPDVQRRRLYGFLGRKGFAPEVIHDVVRRLAPRGPVGRRTDAG